MKITLHKDWYTIEDVAKLFECKTEDINHFIQAGKLEPVLWFDSEPGTFEDADGNVSEERLDGLWGLLHLRAAQVQHGERKASCLPNKCRGS